MARAVRHILAVCLASTMASGVELRQEDGPPKKLYVTGDTYAMVVNADAAVIEKFAADGQDLIGDSPLCPTINTSKPDGPAAIDIVQNGPVLAEVRLADLRYPGLDADIEIVLYCYPTRAIATVSVTPRGAVPDMMVGWYGGVKYSMPLLMRSEEELHATVSFNGQNPKCAAVVAEPWVQFGLFGKKLRSVVHFRNSVGRISGGYGYRSSYTCPRRASIMLFGCESNEALKDAVRGEAALPFADVTVRGGRFARYDGSRGFFRVARDAAGGPGEIQIDVALKQPTPPPLPALSVMDRVAAALAKISWRVGTVLFALMAVVVLGMTAQPGPGAFVARMRPRLLALAAAIALAVAAVWLFRMPPPPPPSAVPMPHAPVPAVFRIDNAPASVPFDGPVQVYTRPDGSREAYVAGEVRAGAPNVFVLHGVRVTDDAAVH